VRLHVAVYIDYAVTVRGTVLSHIHISFNDLFPVVYKESLWIAEIRFFAGQISFDLHGQQ